MIRDIFNEIHFKEIAILKFFNKNAVVSLKNTYKKTLKNKTPEFYNKIFKK